MAETTIQWTDKTWNPTTGCTKVGPECLHCYIEKTVPMRVAGKKFVHGKIPIELHENRLDAPLHWKKPCMIFVNSMSDLFHEDVPDEFIDRVFAVMALCPQHTFQVLTKRAERMRQYMADADESPKQDRWAQAACEIDDSPCAVGIVDDTHFPLPNIWLGVSCGNRKQGLPRIDILRTIPAAVRFVSFEPLLEDLGRVDLAGIQWAIIGGESGPGARPCDLAWIRSLVGQCREAGVAPFVKQCGAAPYIDHSEPRVAKIAAAYGVGPLVAEFLVLKDKKGGDIAEFPKDLQVREFPRDGGR